MNAAVVAVAALEVVRRNDINQRRSIGVHSYHSKKLRDDNDLKARAGKLIDSFHRLTYERTFFPGALGPISRFDSTRIARDVYAGFMRYNRLEYAARDTILELFLDNIHTIRAFTDDEFWFICGVDGAHPVYPVPAAVGHP